MTMSKTAEEFLHRKDVAYMNRLSTSLDFDRIVKLMEEYAKLKTSELALTQVPVGDDTPLSRCLKRISELEKENQELKRELARYEIHDLKRK